MRSLSGRHLELLDTLAHPGPTVTYDLEAGFAEDSWLYRTGQSDTFVGIVREIEDHLKRGAVAVRVEVGR